MVVAGLVACGPAPMGDVAAGGAGVVDGEAVGGDVEVAAPELLYVGCEAVRAGPVCLLRPDATLRVWLGVHPETPMRVELDGVVQAVTWVAAEDGLRAVFEPPVASGVLTLRAEDAGWKLELGIAAAEAMPDALVSVQAAIDRGDAEGAGKLLDAAMAGLRGAGLAEGLKLRGDVAFVRGELQAALAAYEPAFVAAKEAGLLRRASEVALTASYLCTAVLYDLPGARGWLARHAELVPLLPEARLRHGYYAGLVADFAGDLGAAQRGYEAHVVMARALGLNEELTAALTALGLLRGKIGDVAGAERALAGLQAIGDESTTVTRAIALQNSAWTAIDARARGYAAPDPERQLAAALALLERDGSASDSLLAAEIRLNLVYAMLVRGDAEAARVALAKVVPSTHTMERWRDFLAARIDVLLGDESGALRRFAAVGRDAEAAGDRWLEWSASVGGGEALERLGRDRAALELYRRAAAIHTVDLEALAMDAGRERFAVERDRGAQRLVLLLLRMKRDGEALCAARRARFQGFAGLAASMRDPAALATYRAVAAELDAKVERTWELSLRAGERARSELRAERRRLDESLDAMLSRTSGMSAASGGCEGLRAPAAGELLLLYYPVEGGYVGFGLDDSGLVVSRVPASIPDDPRMRSEVLLGPFSAALERAQRVRVVASGMLSAENFHALPWADRSLIDAVVVTYALDIPRAVTEQKVQRVVQLGPASNLVGASDEMARVAEGLRARGISVERLYGDEIDLLQRMAGSDLLHYAGHANGEGWGGALELGGDRSIGPRDLLSVAGPRVAVLSGCETGLPDPRAHAGGMSLAHALLLAGAGVVLATDAVVADEVGAAIGSAVVLAIADGSEPAAALAQVQRARTVDAWSHFRAFTP